MAPPLLDTDVLSDLFRRDPFTVDEVRSYHSRYGILHFSVISRYEYLRGLHTIPAPVAIREFENLCARSHVVPFTPDAAREAAEIWAHFETSEERSVGTGDILISGLARAENRAIATKNVRDFSRVPGIHVLDWREPT